MGTHLEQYSQQINQISDTLLAEAAAQFAVGGRTAVTLLRSAPNPFLVKGHTLALAAPTTTAGQRPRPFPPYTTVQLAGPGASAGPLSSWQLHGISPFARGALLC